MQIYEASKDGKICRYRLLLGEKVLFPGEVHNFEFLILFFKPTNFFIYVLKIRKFSQFVFFSIKSHEITMITNGI